MNTGVGAGGEYAYTYLHYLYLCLALILTHRIFPNNWGWTSKNYCAINSGWAEVLSTGHVVQILNWVALPERFSLSLCIWRGAT